MEIPNMGFNVLPGRILLSSRAHLPSAVPLQGGGIRIYSGNLAIVSSQIYSNTAYSVRPRAVLNRSMDVMFPIPCESSCMLFIPALFHSLPEIRTTRASINEMEADSRTLTTQVLLSEAALPTLL